MMQPKSNSGAIDLTLSSDDECGPGGKLYSENHPAKSLTVIVPPGKWGARIHARISKRTSCCNMLVVKRIPSSSLVYGMIFDNDEIVAIDGNPLLNVDYKGAKDYMKNMVNKPKLLTVLRRPRKSTIPRKECTTNKHKEINPLDKEVPAIGALRKPISSIVWGKHVQILKNIEKGRSSLEIDYYGVVAPFEQEALKNIELMHTNTGQACSRTENMTGALGLKCRNCPFTSLNATNVAIIQSTSLLGVCFQTLAHTHLQYCPGLSSEYKTHLMKIRPENKSRVKKSMNVYFDKLTRILNIVDYGNFIAFRVEAKPKSKRRPSSKAALHTQPNSAIIAKSKSSVDPKYASNAWSVINQKNAPNDGDKIKAATGNEATKKCPILNMLLPMTLPRKYSTKYCPNENNPSISSQVKNPLVKPLIVQAQPTSKKDYQHKEKAKNIGEINEDKSGSDHALKHRNSTLAASDFSVQEINTVILLNKAQLPQPIDNTAHKSSDTFHSKEKNTGSHLLGQGPKSTPTPSIPPFPSMAIPNPLMVQKVPHSKNTVMPLKIPDEIPHSKENNSESNLLGQNSNSQRANSLVIQKVPQADDTIMPLQTFEEIPDSKENTSGSDNVVNVLSSTPTPSIPSFSAMFGKPANPLAIQKVLQPNDIITPPEPMDNILNSNEKNSESDHVINVCNSTTAHSIPSFSAMFTKKVNPIMAQQVAYPKDTAMSLEAYDEIPHSKENNSEIDSALKASNLTSALPIPSFYAMFKTPDTPLEKSLEQQSKDSAMKPTLKYQGNVKVGPDSTEMDPTSDLLGKNSNSILTPSIPSFSAMFTQQAQPLLIPQKPQEMIIPRPSLLVENTDNIPQSFSFLGMLGSNPKQQPEILFEKKFTEQMHDISLSNKGNTELKNADPEIPIPYSHTTSFTRQLYQSSPPLPENPIDSSLNSGSRNTQGFLSFSQMLNSSPKNEILPNENLTTTSKNAGKGNALLTSNTKMMKEMDYKMAGNIDCDTHAVKTDSHSKEGNNQVTNKKAKTAVNKNDIFSRPSFSEALQIEISKDNAGRKIRSSKGEGASSGKTHQSTRLPDETEFDVDVIGLENANEDINLKNKSFDPLDPQLSVSPFNKTYKKSNSYDKKKIEIKKKRSGLRQSDKDHLPGTKRGEKGVKSSDGCATVHVENKELEGSLHYKIRNTASSSRSETESDSETDSDLETDSDSDSDAYPETVPRKRTSFSSASELKKTVYTDFEQTSDFSGPKKKTPGSDNVTLTQTGTGKVEEIQRMTANPGNSLSLARNKIEYTTGEESLAFDSNHPLRPADANGSNHPNKPKILLNDIKFVFPRDRKDISDFVFLLLEQVKPCNSDPLQLDASIGIECKHCCNTGETKFQLFPTSVRRFKNCVKSMHDHIVLCDNVHGNTKRILIALKNQQTRDFSKIKLSRQDDFYDRVWDRLHGVSDESHNNDTSKSTGPFSPEKKSNPKSIYDSGGLEPSNGADNMEYNGNSKIKTVNPLKKRKALSMGTSDTSPKQATSNKGDSEEHPLFDMGNKQNSLSPTKYENEDAKEITPVNVVSAVINSQEEDESDLEPSDDLRLVFPADREDVGDFIYLLMEQVQPISASLRCSRIGIECKHCCNDHGFRLMPNSMRRFRSCLNPFFDHLVSCKKVPLHVREQLGFLKAREFQEYTKIKPSRQAHFFNVVWGRIAEIHENCGSDESNLRKRRKTY